MDRDRLVSQIVEKGIEAGSGHIRVVRELGRGGNGAAFLCQSTAGEVVAKVYVPPDHRDVDATALKRFENEVALTARIRHPNVVRSIESGVVRLAAYALPFYTMPLAAGTLSKYIPKGPHPADGLDVTLRLFFRACLGVACLHSNGVVHRDLKPDNILVSKVGAAWVADLGIAHISPDFVSAGLKTIASEQLLNRDYYAPEQRFGSATDVDHRCDIYALGCILYELLSGVPPVRNNSPSLGKVASMFAPFESIANRMFAFDPKDRYAVLEDALEDIAVAMGLVVAGIAGIRPTAGADIDEMTRLLKSSNEDHRQAGMRIARHLGHGALPVLHDLMGHGRRDVRNATAVALGEIAAEESLPILTAGLYGTSDKAAHFRPSADAAATALAQYPIPQRVEAVRSIRSKVSPLQLTTILSGVAAEVAYPIVTALLDRNLVLFDYSDKRASLLVQIDEDKAWPEVEHLLAQGKDFEIDNVIPRLSMGKQANALQAWIGRGISDGWWFDRIVTSVLESKLLTEQRAELLREIEAQALTYSGAFKKRDAVLRMIRSALKA